MNAFLTKIIMWVAGDRLKNYMRDMFYGEILSERIVEYPIVTMEMGRELKDGASIMDVGCYYSNLSLQLASLGYKVTGVDFQEYALTHPNFKFVKGDILELDFKQKFDAVSIVSTVEHIGLGHYEEYQKTDGDVLAMARIKKHLKPKGKVFLTVPFGVKSQTETYRTYDWKSIQDLLTGYKIKKSLFYTSRKGKWIPVSRADALKVKNGERVNGVAFVLAEK